MVADEERFFYRLIVQCDDFGRMDARPAILRARCFPLQLAAVSCEDITTMLARFQALGVIILYEVEGRPYLEIPGWANSQRVRNARSKYPPRSTDRESPRVAASRHLESESESLSESEKKRGRPRPPTLVPTDEDFPVSAADRAHALRAVGCANPALFFEHFRVVNLEKQRRSSRWDLVFRQWVLKHNVYGCPCQRRGSVEPPGRRDETARHPPAVVRPGGVTKLVDALKSACPGLDALDATPERRAEDRERTAIATLAAQRRQLEGRG